MKQYHSNGRTPPPPPADIIDDESEWEGERILGHRFIKRGRKTQTKYLITFVGYGHEHNMQQDDIIEHCGRLVMDYWASKPESERLVVMLFPRTRAHGDPFMHV